jgi:GT2 family glycosyltransferase
MKRVTVIIPNYNGEKLLPTCLGSLQKQEYRDFSVTVVDNGSTDDSVLLLEEQYPDVKVITLKSNRGFSAAVNAGIKDTSSELVALLNNDAEAGRCWLGELVSAIDRHPEISFCASKMIDFYDRSVIDSAGNCYAINGRSIPRGFLEKDTGQYEKEEEVFGACAGAALYRRSLFKDVGLFDERFISYKEDVDLDFRALLKGHRCLYVPKAVCYHMGGATTGRRKSDTAVMLSARNSIIAFIKNMPRHLLPQALPAMAFDQVFQLGYQLLKGAQLGPFCRGILGAMGRLPHSLRERGKTQKSSKPDLEYLKQLLHAGSTEVKRYRRRCRTAEQRL